MASTTGLQTVNFKDIQEVNADPSAAGGTAATDPGSIALSNNGGVGQLWLKTGTADTAWDRLVSANDGTFIAPGAFLRLALFDTSPGPAAHLADTALQNTKNIYVDVVAQPSRSANLSYNFPNPGDAISSADVVLTEGAQTLNGAKTFSALATFNGGLTVNGTLTYVNSTNLQVSDPLITLNKGGAAASGGGVGFEIEENAAITGYFKTTADRNGWVFRAPNVAFDWTLDLSNLTAARIVKAPDSAGTMVLRPNATTQVAGQVTFWSDANNVTSESNLFWDATNHRLSVASGNAPTDTVDITGTVRMRNMTAGSVIYAGVNGVLSQDNANHFWDGTNHRLGLGTASPARLLDVNGSSIFHAPLRQQDATATKANWERFQAQVSTTDATQTTLATIATISDSNMYLKAVITARRTGGASGSADDAAIFTRTARVKNVAGTVTLYTLQTDYTSKDVKAWDATITVSGTNALLKVTGAATTNVDWTVTYEVITLS